MQPTPRHKQAESRFRALLDEAGLPLPDRVEHEPTSIVVYWDGPRVAVVIDLETAPGDPLDALDSLGPPDPLERGLSAAGARAGASGGGRRAGDGPFL